MVHGVSIGSGWQPWGRRREKTGGPVTWVGGSSLPFWCPQIKVGLWRCSDIDTRAQILEACGGQAGRQAGAVGQFAVSHSKALDWLSGSGSTACPGCSHTFVGSQLWHKRRILYRLSG